MAERLSDLLKLLALGADDPLVDAVFVSYRLKAGDMAAMIHAPDEMKALCHETILLATEAAHKPADGLH